MEKKDIRREIGSLTDLIELEEYYRSMSMSSILMHHHLLLEQAYSLGLEDKKYLEIEETCFGRWISVDEQMPNDGERVVVLTKSGAIYCGTAWNGKMMPNVRCWIPIPPIPNE